MKIYESVSDEVFAAGRERFTEKHSIVVLTLDVETCHIGLVPKTSRMYVTRVKPYLFWVRVTPRLVRQLEAPTQDTYILYLSFRFQVKILEFT
jgi:hypothetical protein